MRFSSLNCWGVDRNKNRFAAIAAALVAQSAEVIVLQEVIFSWQVKLLNDALGDLYETFYPEPKIGLLNRGGLYTAVKRSLYPRQETRFQAFSRQTPWLHPLGWSDALLEKGWSSVIVDCFGEPFYVYNTHLLGAYGIMKGEQAVMSSQRQELENAVAKCDYALFVCGDLNITPDMFGEDSLFRQMDEAFNLEGEPITVDNQGNPLRQGLLPRLSGRGSSRPDKRIDYAFASGFKIYFPELFLDRPVESYRYCGFLSDHYGITFIV